MSSYYRIFALAALLIVSLLVFDHFRRQSRSEWESQVTQVGEQVRLEREAAEVAKREAAERLAAAEALADSLARQAPEIRTRIVRVQAETPDSLRNEPAILQRDSLIADLRTEADGWRGAYEKQKGAYTLLAEALRLAESSRDSLVAVIADRPGARPWYVPRVGVGPFVGVCATGKPCVGPVAATVAWEIKL